MERWIDDRPIPIEIAGGQKPYTVWHIKQKTEEELNLFEASLERVRDAQKRLTGEITGPDHILKEVEMDREMVASAIAKVCNVREAGDEIDDHAEILALLKATVAARYRILRGLIVGSLDVSVFEVKASSSRSEQQPKSSE